MSESEKTDRRSRIVMALGIATVVLFSANLLAMVARHFWPDLRETALFRSESQDISEAEAQFFAFHTNFDYDFSTFADADHKRHQHRRVIRTPRRIVFRKPHAVTGTITYQTDAISDKLEQLERDLAREEARLNNDMDASLEDLEARLTRMQAELAHESGSGFSPPRVAYSPLRIKVSGDGTNKTFVYSIEGDSDGEIHHIDWAKGDISRGKVQTAEREAKVAADMAEAALRVQKLEAAKKINAVHVKAHKVQQDQ